MRASGRVVTQTYAASSGIASDRTASLADSPTSTTLLQSVEDNAAGLLTSRTLGTGITETRSFNARNQLTRIAAAANSDTLLDIGYGYGDEKDGRIRARTDAVQPEHSANYTFDAIGRLTEVGGGGSGSNWGISWVLDRYGNRTAQAPTGLASGRVGAPLSFYGNPNTTNRNTALKYDNAGNVIDDTDHVYTYDAENRLIQIDNSSTQYAYDSAGRRIKKIANGVTTYYFYGLTGLMSEFDTTDTDITQAAATDRLQYRVGEQTGTAVMLVDPDGKPRENNRVFPFGEPWNSFAESNNKEKFTTYQHDADSGEAQLDYAMARYYASRSARFMTADPGHVGANVGDPQSWNAYVYVDNDPINFVDPAGLCKDGRDKQDPTLPCFEVTVRLPRNGYGFGGGGFDFGWWPSFNDWAELFRSVGRQEPPPPPPPRPEQLGRPSQLLSVAGQVVGSWWTAENTKIGVAYGLIGIPSEGIGFEYGQIQFKGNLLQGLFGRGRAITLGEAGIYAPGVGPQTITGAGQPLGLEESYHSRQARVLGPFYLPAHFVSGVASYLLTRDWHKANPLEQGPHHNPPRRF